MKQKSPYAIGHPNIGYSSPAVATLKHFTFESGQSFTCVSLEDNQFQIEEVRLVSSLLKYIPSARERERAWAQGRSGEYIHLAVICDWNSIRIHSRLKLAGCCSSTFS